MGWMLNWICLTWAHVPVGGLLVDVAGAIALGWAFSTKKPEAIRLEVPEVLTTNIGGGARFPQALAHSMIRQRSEARLGLTLLVSGLVAQLAGPVCGLGSLETSGQRWTVFLLAAAIWALIYAFGWRLYVPWDARRARQRMDELEPADLAGYAAE
jgi:hypothetical protein